MPFEVGEFSLPASPDVPHPAVVHPYNALALVVEGEAQFWIGAQYGIRAGDVVLVPEGMPHYLVAARDYRLVGLRFCLGCLDPDVSNVLGNALDQVRRGRPAVRSLGSVAAAQLEQWLRRLWAEGRTSGVARRLAERGLLALVAAEVARASVARPEPHAETVPPIVADALAFITDHAGAPISLQDVARAVGRAPGHVAAVVREHTGRPVGAWIVESRMAIARQLLLQTDVGVSEVADRVGYASLSHFHRAFKRAHGTSPGVWRRSHRSQAPLEG